MAARLKAFLAEERAQDLIEYTLLLSFIAIIIAAIATTDFGFLVRIWTSVTNWLRLGAA